MFTQAEINFINNFREIIAISTLYYVGVTQIARKKN